MRRAQLATAAAAAALVLAQDTQAALRVDVVASEPGAPPEAGERYVIWIDGPLLAAEPVRSAGGPPSQRLVYRAGEDVAWLVDLERRSYFQLDPESAERHAEQLAGVRDGVESGIELLPPQQRAKARKLLGDLTGAGSSGKSSASLPAPHLRALGEAGSYAGIGCERHEVLEAERRLAVVCLGAYGKGLPPRERVAAVASLGGFLHRTLGPLAREFPRLRPLSGLAALERLPGFPLAVRSFEAAGRQGEAEVTRVEEAAADPSLFEVPQGFARSLVPPFG
jgi:hypothetical protein